MKQLHSISLKKLESPLKTQIKNLYEHQLKHQIGDVTFFLWDRTLIVIIEGSVTKLEQWLNENNHQELARQVRTAIDNFIQPQIKILIEEQTNLSTIDYLSETNINTSRTGAIAIFGLQPKSVEDGGG